VVIAHTMSGCVGYSSVVSAFSSEHCDALLFMKTPIIKIARLIMPSISAANSYSPLTPVIIADAAQMTTEMPERMPAAV